MAETDVLLTLETFFERKSIKINGRLFELRNIDELGLVPAARCARIVERVRALQGKGLEAITEDEAAALERDLAAIVGVILVQDGGQPLPDLTVRQQLEIFQAFSARHSGGRHGADAQVRGSRQTGAPSSPGSRGSTRVRRRRTG